MKGGDREEGKRGKRWQYVGKIKRNFIRPKIEHAGAPRHVPVAGPTFEFTAIVLRKARETAIGDERLNSGVEGGGEHGVMAPQRMADAADFLGVNLGQRLQ